MQINEINGIAKYLNHDKPAMDEKRLASPQNQALEELEEITEDSALYETLEDISLALSGKLRERDKAAEAQQRKRQILLDMMSHLEEGEGGALSSTFSEEAETMSLGRQILASSMLLAGKKLSEKKRQELISLLDELMENMGWEVDLFGLIELGKIDKPAFSAIKKLFSQAMDEENVSLAEWFQRISQWPDRHKRVCVLLRALAFELTVCAQGEQQTRLAVVLTRLRRLLIFLGLEQECSKTEKLCDLAANSLLPLLIDITSQSWVFSDWLTEKIDELMPPGRLQKRLLQLLGNLFFLMPDACFQDADHRTQIIGVIGEVRGDEALL